MTDGTSNTMVVSEARTQFESAPTNPRERDMDRMSVLGEGTVGNYVDPDLSSMAGSVSLTHRGSPWITGRHYATGYSAYSRPNAKVPGIWLRGSELIFEGASSNHPGVVVVGMGDGSARNVSEQIELNIWRAAATTSGAETQTL